jgi:hypothetical protein
MTLPDATARRAMALEEVWDRHGALVEMVARRHLGDPLAARAAAMAVMAEVAQRLAGDPAATGSPLLAPWLVELTAEVCARPQPAAAAPRTLAEAVPLRLRLHYWFAADAQRSADDARRLYGPSPVTERRRRLGAVPLVPLMWRRVRAACSDVADHARALSQRLAPNVLANPPGVAGLQAGAAGASGIGEAVVAVAASVAFALVGPGTAVTRPAGDPGRPASIAMVREAAEPEVASEPGERATGALRDPTEAAEERAPAQPAPERSEPVVPPAVSPVHPAAPAPTSLPTTPTVETEPTGSSGGDVVRRTPHDEGEERRTPGGGDVTVDVGDGENGATIGVPSAFVDCPEPDERGIVLGAVCMATGEPGALGTPGTPEQ